MGEGGLATDLEMRLGHGFGGEERERRRAAVSLPAPTAGVQLNHPFQAGLTPWTILSSLIPRLLGKKIQIWQL